MVKEDLILLFVAKLATLKLRAVVKLRIGPLLRKTQMIRDSNGRKSRLKRRNRLFLLLLPRKMTNIMKILIMNLVWQYLWNLSPLLRTIIGQLMFELVVYY
jgi:hypothetical protein